ncbi:aryl-alcohol dehydrogenase-like predicted oxidoreductase [Microbacterium resistens]|uniref:Aryl-alcohol dehydrogenase-like predicted oxidoreductase n=1 Tax=Microbacterium resistens TaxID=156977 RepID=A0ABU1SGE3_9MICO|nr:aldo/keto reductase [Microbacterium resistens]MDR6868656.1 aryl-alcohol dehydrogenase-like predicted oxidoreductase [Microbacterium resistens]
MRLFGVGTVGPAERVEPAGHPSAPIPVVGPGIGTQIRVPLGETGVSAFPLMLGGAEFGWNTDTATSNAILDRYAEFGGNAVHTADSFAAGRSEYIIGQWLHSRGCRDDFVLGVRVGAHPDNPGIGSVNLVRAVESSLTRLGVERIDVLYLDGSLDDGSALEDTLATTEWLTETGKVGALGAFGFSPERLVEARILASAGYPRIEVLDEPYNLLRREPYEGDLRLVAGAQGLAVTPSHALEHGFLSGRHRSKQALNGVRGMQLRSNINRRGIKVLRALDLVANELQVPVAAVAVAWLLAQRTITAPIVNAFSTEHVEELIQGAGVSLSRAQLAELARAAA